MPKSHSEPESMQVKPDPKLEKRSRRQFSTDYKLKIISEAAACKHGELGALLRREKLYSNQLATWKKEYAEKGVAGLSKSAPGPSSSTTPEQRKIIQLEKENQRLLRKLEIANDCMDLQKKTLKILDHMSNGSDV
jgi:transposase-like protein